MSPPESERRRQLLDNLRAMKKGGPAPEPAALFMSSSTSGPTGTAERPISINGTPEPQPANGVLVPSSSPGPYPAPLPAPRGSTAIPSSNLARTAATLGSPLGALNAVRGGNGNGVVAGAAGSVSPNGAAAAGKPSLADFSPSSPQPLSRLKKRYGDDESPTKPAAASLVAAAAAGGAGPSRSGAAVSRFQPKGRGTPKLIAAAKAEHNSERETAINRFMTQFPNVPRHDIAQAMYRHGDGEPQALLNELRRANNKPAATAPPPKTVNLQAFAFQPAVPSSSSIAPPPSVSASLSLPTMPGLPQASASTTSAAAVMAQAAAARPNGGKRRKNEKSTIYANREEKKSKKRDPDNDESESEAEADSDGGSDAWSGDETRKRKKRRSTDEDDVDAEGAALEAFNNAEASVLTGTIACSDEQAERIISLRPYDGTDDVYQKLSKARGVSYKLFEQYTEIMEGYVQIDACLNRCESIANDIAHTLSVWKGAATLSSSVTGTPRSDGLNDVKVDVDKVSELLRNETDMKRRKILSSYIRTQPSLLSDGTVLKDYQLLGVNWLNLLWSRKIGCILADEMGLGKTIQVIAFLAYLKEKGVKGPHMIFVPASTLENWTREFDRFAPDIDVQTYYGSQNERAELREVLKRKARAGELEVVLASYTQVASHDDLKFFRRKIDFETCVYDEAHALKSFTTKRYQDLVSIRPKWRLLLTGTPVQNNLQELVSLLMFIHKDIFVEAEPYLRAIFKVQSQGQVNMLSQQRVSRARTMLTPFVLRRRKANVLTLPPKIERVQECEMTPTQARLYRETLRRSRKAMAEMSEEALAAVADEDEDGKKKPKGKAAKGKVVADKNSSANILMDLRKAASHPLLFRRLYNSAKVQQIAKACLNTPKWCDSRLDYVIEDLEVMSDAEIHHFVTEHEELEHFALTPDTFLECGKVQALKEHIDRCIADGKRMLLFSQFTMILDILQVTLDHLNIRYIRLDGGTRTDERQGLVDDFNDDEEITVFLLSTKAGGVGINLTAASVVVIFDQDFNPHNDRQAADRAYRIGQEREVEVIKLISKDSIDEDILSIGVTKLQLDDMVGGDESPDSAAGGAAGGAAATGDGAGGDDKTARELKKSLLTTLRKKFEAEGDEKALDDDLAANAEDGDVPMPESTQVKRARGVTAKVEPAASLPL